ncbi:MAG: hypothetical protein ACRDAG_01645 [Cetobacterium somerae]|uniref:hypothetical protein n=1 Tax=Cetobacterium somerae TaxID=188913 RepID=UPI003F36895B
MGADISFAIKCSKVIYLSTEVLKKKEIPVDLKEYAENLLFTALSLLAEDAVFSKVGEKEFKKLCGDVELYKELRLSFEKNYTNYTQDLEKLRGAIFNIDDILNNFTQKI